MGPSRGFICLYLSTILCLITDASLLQIHCTGDCTSSPVLISSFYESTSKISLPSSVRSVHAVVSKLPPVFESHIGFQDLLTPLPSGLHLQVMSEGSFSHVSPDHVVAANVVLSGHVVVDNVTQFSNVHKGFWNLLCGVARIGKKSDDTLSTSYFRKNEVEFEKMMLSWISLVNGGSYFRDVMDGATQLELTLDKGSLALRITGVLESASRKLIESLKKQENGVTFDWSNVNVPDTDGFWRITSAHKNAECEVASLFHPRASLKRSLGGQGYHRTLDSELQIRIPRSMISSSHVTVAVVETLPLHTFPDAYELQENHRFGGNDFFLMHDPDVEVSSDHIKAVSSLLTVFTNHSLTHSPPNDEHVIQATVRIPIHLRYQPPGYESHRAADIPTPHIFVKLPHTNTKSSQSACLPVFCPHSEDGEWVAVRYDVDALNSVLTAPVPVGLLPDAHMIALGTLSVTVIGCLVSIWFVWRHSSIKLSSIFS